MAIEDYFGYNAPADRQIGGEWYTWVTDPSGQGGRMVAYSELSPAEQQKLAIGREYGANVYTDAEKAYLTDTQAQDIWQSYSDPLREALSGVTAPEVAPSSDEQAYTDFMRQLYEADALTPDQRAAYEQNMGIEQPVAEPPPVQPPPVPTPTTPPPNMDGALANQFEQGIRNTLAVNNPYDFMNWQSELGGDQRLGEATGGPAGSYGGGAVWNQVTPQSEAPVQFPANVRPYGAGIDPNFGQTPFDPGQGAAGQYRDFMKQLYDAGALTDEQRAAYEQNTGMNPTMGGGTSTAIGTRPYNPYAPGNALQAPITSRD